MKYTAMRILWGVQKNSIFPPPQAILRSVPLSM